MKVLKLSDIHQYSKFMFDRFFNKLPNKDLYDIVIIAGDITNGNLDFLKYIITKFEKPVYFVLGNHDYYYLAIPDVIEFCLNNNLNLLYGSNEYVINSNNKEYTIIGGTGWSSYNLYGNKNYYKKFSHKISDFSLIYTKDNKLVTPNDYEKYHNQEWEFYSQYKNKPNVILVTHFPMSKVCLDPFYDRPDFRNLNPYFINDKDTTGFKVIFSGHTHTCINTKDQYGCTHIINAYGYESEFNRIEQNNLLGTNGFDSHKIINVDDYL